MSDFESQETRTPTQYRLVVKSAAEAVSLVRDRFGVDAKVLAVKQLESGGLVRFLQKPRLEVIVEVGASAPTKREAEEDEVEERLSLSAEAIGAASTASQNSETEAPDSTEAPNTETTSATRSRPQVDRSMALLRAAGLDDALLERVRADQPEFDWIGASAPEVVGRLAAWLRREYMIAAKRTVGHRRVFFGSCGSGKTTALCKTLAMEVFVRGSQPAVLKLDGAHPNASDGLAAFCDVLNTPLLRSTAEVEEFDRDALLVVDVPGVGIDARADQAQLVQTLDALSIDTRILVVNAACETEVIEDAYEMGRACGATHVVFTHLDEVRRPGKLWRFALFGGLAPLAACSGPSPADELEEDVFSALLSRSFPATLARVSNSQGGEA